MTSKGSCKQDVIRLLGHHPFVEIAKHRPQTIVEVHVARDSTRERELAAELDKLAARGVAVHHVSKDELDELADGGNHQGIVFSVEPPAFADLATVLEHGRASGIVLALDQISDPQNYGAILRVAECAGVGGVITLERRSAPLSQAAARASAGASALVPIAQVGNLREAFKQAKRDGYWIVGTGLSETAQSLYDAELPQPMVLVLGAEGKGLRPLVERECDMLVKIPLRGAIQSLNVSQAASVVLFELVRRGLTQ